LNKTEKCNQIKLIWSFFETQLLVQNLKNEPISCFGSLQKIANSLT
jgi:hypothetical protein